MIFFYSNVIAGEDMVYTFCEKIILLRFFKHHVAALFGGLFFESLYFMCFISRITI